LLEVEPGEPVVTSAGSGSDSLANLEKPQVPENASLDETDEVTSNAELMSDPLWLLGTIHSSNEEDRRRVGDILDHEPVRRRLLPAARSFLESRRCCPFRAIAHLQLASLDYLLASGESADVHIDRALRMVGSDAQALMFAAATSDQVGDLGLAARCWRKSLEVCPQNWIDVADAAGAALPARQVLDEVLPPEGSLEIRISDRLYADPEDEEDRAIFLHAVPDRVAANKRLTEAERNWIQGQALARLDQRDEGRNLMLQALKLDAGQSDWRREYIVWLLEWGLVKDAHAQARIGVALDSKHKGLRDVHGLTVDALARGVSSEDNDSASSFAGSGERIPFASQVKSGP
jgi:hypothetical protein